MISEEQINRWASPPSETESEKCTNAITGITAALKGHFGDAVRIVRQGSHYNRTNTRLESDVDLAVVHSATHFPDTGRLTPADKQLHNQASSPATYAYSTFKAEVHAVLQKHFGATNVVRKNKCIRVNENSYRVNADVVPAFDYVRYSAFGVVEATGVGFIPDNSAIVTHSFPVQHYESGVKKNEATGKAFKAVVRVLKNVRNDLRDKGLLRLGDMPSFFIESLVWNVPSTYFAGATYRDDALAVADKIWNDMRDPVVADAYAEVCDLRWLFKGSSQRTHARAEDFTLQVWSHIRTA